MVVICVKQIILIIYGVAGLISLSAKRFGGINDHNAVESTQSIKVFRLPFANICDALFTLLGILLTKWAWQARS